MHVRTVWDGTALVSALVDFQWSPVRTSTVVHTPKQFYHGTRLKRCKVRQPVSHIALSHA